MIVDGTGQVDVSAAGGGRLGQSFELGVVVDQAQGEWASGRDAVVDAGFDDDAVGFKLLALAAAIAALTRSSSRLIGSRSRVIPAGKPSTMAVRAGP